MNKVNYKEDFTGVCASKEEWHAAFEEFLCDHTYDELPSSDVLVWNYGMKLETKK